MKDLDALSTLSLTCELLAAAIQVRNEAQSTPWNRTECLRVLTWMHQHARQDIDAPLISTDRDTTISGDGVATDAQSLIDQLMECRTTLRQKHSPEDTARILRALQHVTLGIDQLLGAVARSIGRGAVHVAA